MVAIITYINGTQKIMVLSYGEIEPLMDDKTITKIEVASIEENMSEDPNERHAVLVEYETYGQKSTYQNTNVALTDLPETIKAMIEINTGVGMEISTIIVIPTKAFKKVMEETARLSFRGIL